MYELKKIRVDKSFAIEHIEPFANENKRYFILIESLQLSLQFLICYVPLHVIVESFFIT